MSAIVVAIIGLLGTVITAAFPKLWERYLARSGAAPNSPRPYPLPVLVIVAGLSAFGVWGAWAYSDSNSITSVLFFLAVVAICSTIYANGCLREGQLFGTYVGYCSSLAAALLGLWWLLGDWTYVGTDGHWGVRQQDHPIHILYAAALTGCLLGSLMFLSARREMAKQQS